MRGAPTARTDFGFPIAFAMSGLLFAGLAQAQDKDYEQDERLDELEELLFEMDERVPSRPNMIANLKMMLHQKCAVYCCGTDDSLPLSHHRKRR